MAEYNPDDLIDRTFVLPPNQKGERHRASIKQKVIEISQKVDEDHNALVDNINFLFDVGQGDHKPSFPTAKCWITLRSKTKMMRHSTSSGPSQIITDY